MTLTLQTFVLHHQLVCFCFNRPTVAIMQALLALVAFSVVSPAAVHSQGVVRNAYSEAQYLGARTFLTLVDKAGLNTLLKDPRGDCFSLKKKKKKKKKKTNI